MNPSDVFIGVLFAGMAVVLLLVGSAIQESAIIDDCETLGKFRLRGVVYECVKLEPA